MKLKHLLLTALAVMGMGSANAQEVPTDGTSYYLYNTETGKFLTRGNDWGTRAIVNNYGQPWKVTIQDGKYKLQMLDMVNEGNNSNLNENYSDNGTAVAYAPTGDANGYVLGNGTGWLGVSDSYYANTAGSDAAKTWQFLTKAQYDAKLADFQAAQYQAIIDASLIDATPATLASVLASATATDVTTAAGLNGVPSKSTWAETQHAARKGDYNEGTYGLECYQTGNAHITKTVNGLDEGIYKVKVKAMYRSSTNAACLATGNQGYTNSSAYFAANGYTVQIKDWYSSHTGDAAPNGTGDVVNIINNGGYTSEFYTYVGPSGTLNLEAVSEAYWGLGWFIFNGVELTKYSDYPTQSMADNTDLTSWLTNPSFESGNMNGWTNNSADGMWTMMTRANAADPKVGVYWVEKYKTSGKIDVSQTLTKMPAGHYQVSVTALDQASKTKLIAQSGSVTIETPIVGGTKAVYTADIMLDDNSDLKIGIYCDSHNANSWVGFDDFHLTYVSAELPELPASVTGAMNADVASAQTAAVNTYNTNKTAANYNAALVAIAAAQASKTAYTNGQYFVIQANSALGTTFTTSDPAAVSAVQTKYNAGEYADNVITNRVTLIGERTTGLIPTYMLGGWNSADVYINTWSTEGDNDGSNFKTPFYEYWVTDANALADKTITGTLTGLENGLYSVSADVRVRAKNEVAVAEATGINLVAGDGTYAGSEGNGTVDATEGTQIGTSQMSKSTVTAYALVKDGNLTANFVVEGTNISWLAFQNVTYAKVRDLTLEEQIVYATEDEIAAFNASVTAAEAKTIGFMKDEYAPYNNAAAIAALKAAKALDVENPIDIEVLTPVKEALDNATWTANTEEVNAVYDGGFSKTTAQSDSYLVPTGWTNLGYNTRVYNQTNKGSNSGVDAGSEGGCLFAKFTTTYGEVEGYEMPLKAGTYTLKFIYGGWNEAGTRDIKVYDAADNTIAATVTPNKVTAKDTKAHTTVSSWSSYEGLITIPSDGNYVLSFYRQGATQNQIAISDLAIFSISEAELAKRDLLPEIESYEVPTTNIGDAAFQYPTDGINAVKATIEAAQAVYDNADATLEEVNEAIEAMKALTNPALNVPEDGDKFHVAIKYDGYRYSGHALEANATATSGVAVPLADNTANNNYPNDWTFTPVDGTKNGFTMSITTAEGTYYVCTGAQDNGSSDSQIRMTTDRAKALTIVVSPAKSQEGVYYLNNSRASNASIGCQDDRDSNGGWYTTGSHNTHTITLATKATATIKAVAEDESKFYGTFIAPFEVDLTAISNDVKAYIPTIDGNNIVLEDEMTTIPANTPVLLESTSEIDGQNLEGWGLATKDSYTEGVITGTLVKNMDVKSDANNSVYLLQKNNDKVAFYLADTDPYTVSANRCYLSVAKTQANVRALFFNDDATVIKNIEVADDAPMYNVSGARVDKNYKGIVIKNGKKFFVK